MLAQLARAPRLHRGGRGFESLTTHQSKNRLKAGFLMKILLIVTIPIMTDLLIVKNIEREGPGLLQGLLEEHHISHEIIEASDPIPDEIKAKAVVVLGGPPSANDTDERMHKELALAKQAVDTQTPYLGICLGMQVLVKAAGGNVVKNSVKEIGFIDSEGNPYIVETTKVSENDPLMAGLGRTERVFQLHGETVELTDAMELLASGKHCQNQVVRVGDNAYGIQSHFELTPEMLAIWASEDPDLIPLGVQELTMQFREIKSEYTKTGQTFFANFLKIAKLI